MEGDYFYIQALKSRESGVEYSKHLRAPYLGYDVVTPPSALTTPYSKRLGTVYLKPVDCQMLAIITGDMQKRKGVKGSEY